MTRDDIGSGRRRRPECRFRYRRPKRNFRTSYGQTSILQIFPSRRAAGCQHESAYRYSYFGLFQQEFSSRLYHLLLVRTDEDVVRGAFYFEDLASFHFLAKLLNAGTCDRRLFLFPPGI